MLLLSRILDTFKLECTRKSEKEEEIPTQEIKEKKAPNTYKRSEQKKPKNIPEPKRMNNYDLEQFAKECNAYMIREERKEQNK